MSVLVERRDAVQWITINRPERRNALNAAVVQGIADGMQAAMDDDSVRAIVLTGAGDRAFCAGGDLAPTADGAPFHTDPARPDNFVIGLFRLFERCEKPVVARVNGAALAGGLGLLCACDLAVASDQAIFGTPETRIGLFPMMILPYLQRTLSRRKLLELCITGEHFGAAAALEMGLLNYIAPPAELDAKLDWLLARIVDKSPTAVRLGKHGFHAMQDMVLDQAFAFAQLMLPAMARTQDAREGFAAFAQKRPPVWTGA